MQSLGPQQSSCVVFAAWLILGLGHSVIYILMPTTRRCIVPGFLNLCLVEIVPFAFPARAVHVQSPMHGVHTWPKVLVWTPETVRALQSERDISVPCCLYLSEDSNALAYISGGKEGGGRWGGGGAGRANVTIYLNLDTDTDRDVDMHVNVVIATRPKFSAGNRRPSFAGNCKFTISSEGCRALCAASIKMANKHSRAKSPLLSQNYAWLMNTNNRGHADYNCACKQKDNCTYIDSTAPTLTLPHYNMDIET